MTTATRVDSNPVTPCKACVSPQKAEPVTPPPDKFASLFRAYTARLFHAILRQLPLVKTFTVNCEWDEEAKLWYVSDSDVPGLVGEARSIEEMSELLRQRIPELLALNCPQVIGREREVPWELVARRHGRAALVGT